MKIPIKPGQSAYDALSDVLFNFAEMTGLYETWIVDIKTTILGKDRIVADYNGSTGYDFLDDWYEGGELELLGVRPISQVTTIPL